MVELFVVVYGERVAGTLDDLVRIGIVEREVALCVNGTSWICWAATVRVKVAAPMIDINCLFILFLLLLVCSDFDFDCKITKKRWNRMPQSSKMIQISSITPQKQQVWTILPSSLDDIFIPFGRK